MQGSEIKCNFISGTPNAVLFDDDGGTHTQQANWDSNLVVVQAVDPTDSYADAVIVKNNTLYSVPRFTFRGESWIGGLAATAKVVEGKFTSSTFYFSFASAILENQFDLDGTGNTVDITRKDGLTSTALDFVYTTDTEAAVAWKGRTLYTLTLAAELAAQATIIVYAKHVAASNSSDNYFSVRQVTGGATPVHVTTISNVATIDKELKLRVTNIGSAAIPISTEIDFFLDVIK
jgi:hypothetical protein